MGLRHFRLLVPLLAVLVPAAAAGAAGTATTAPATTAPATTTPITAPPGGGSTSPATTTTTAPAPPPGNVQLLDGGTVTVGVQSLPTEFNPSAPAGDNGITQMVMEQVWPQPFVVSNQLQPVAATPTATSPTFLVSAETVSVNPQTVVYTVDPHARWSDGVPITAADFVYDWHEQLAVGPELGGDAPLQGYRDIRSISSSDKGKVVTVVFAHPYADWYALFADLVPAHVAERYGFQKAFDAFDPHKVLSGGPFEITKVVPGQELVLSRNPHYWGQPAHLSHIVFRVEHGQAAMLAALDDHQVDVAEVMPGLDTTIAVQKAEDLLASNGLSPTLWQLTFNLTDPVTGLQLVREAVAKAINRTETAADSVDYLAENTSIPSNRLFGVAAPGSQGNDGAYAAVDVAQAQQLLAQAGYQPDADGLEIGTVDRS